LTFLFWIDLILVVSLCAAIAAQSGAPLSATAIVEANFTSSDLFCNETDPYFDEAPFFPWVSSNFTFIQPNTTNTTISLYDVPCIGGYSANVTNSTALTCSDPLVVDGEGCSFSCPLPSLTDSQYTSAKIMQGIVAWVSWVFIPPLHFFPFLGKLCFLPEFFRE